MQSLFKILSYLGIDLLLTSIYAMQASAKRFGVTGSGKITRRCAGRAHLLRKKSTKRKNRLAGKVC